MSLGFRILYFPYDSIIAAFSDVGIDAYFDERTPDANLARKVRTWENLPASESKKVSKALIDINSTEIQQFMHALEVAVTREIQCIFVLPLHGTKFELTSVGEAIAFIENYVEKDNFQPVVKYEVEIRYNNGDRIEAQFTDKETAIRFLRSYQFPDIRPC